jgi:antitoxin component YwqK of YwqJK toxin-antitoxin module
MNNREFTYLNGEPFISIYKDGIIQLIQTSTGILINATYKNSVRHGSFETFFPNSRNRRSIFYNVNGKRHGTFKQWYENGTLEVLINFVNNIKHGDAYKFFDDGSLEKSVKYNNGILTTTHIDENELVIVGKRKRDLDIDDNMLHDLKKVC